MTYSDLEHAQHAAPFIPYVVHLPDGRKLKVEHPDFVALSPTGDAAIIHDPLGQWHAVDLAQVSDLSFEPVKPRPKRPTGRS